MAGNENTSTSASSSDSTRDAAMQLLITRIEQLETQSAVKAIKPKAPEYDGTKGNLQGFLTRLRAYHLFYAGSFGNDTAKVIHAATCLTKDALAWFEPIWRNYLEHINDTHEMDEEASRVFQSYSEFEKSIKSVFGDPEEQRTAERQLRNLRQRGSATEYAAKYRQITSRLEDWDDEPLMSQFYEGLKEEVKDELVKEDRPAELSEYIAMAVRIDNRLYERRMEKQGRRNNESWKPKNNNRFQPDMSKRRQNPSTMYGHTGHSGPMELDATQKRPKGKCYSCGKEGHFARDCRSKQSFNKVPERQVSATKEIVGFQERNDITPPEGQATHNNLSWTACYNDECHTHRPDKETSGWYPKAPKRKRTLAMTSRTNWDTPLPKIHQILYQAECSLQPEQTLKQRFYELLEHHDDSTTKEDTRSEDSGNE